MFGSVYGNGGNEDTTNVYRDRDVTAHVRTRRLRWVRPVCRREQGMLLKEIREGKPDGRRPPTRKAKEKTVGQYCLTKHTSGI